MKKLLVLALSAIMVLSLTAAAMAATTINGDFRYDMYQDESATDDESYANTDLRVRVTGDLSETAKATANFQFVRGTKSDSITTKLDEFIATAQYGWGTAKMGYYEYKFTPSRVELKSGQMHVWQKADALFEFNIPVAEGLSIDALVQPYQNNYADDGAYGVAVNYAAEKFGAKFSYANFVNGKNGKVDEYLDSDLMAIDVYYKLTDDMKVFVNAVDYSLNDKKYADIADSWYDQKGIDGIDPVVGFSWANIAGTKLGASIEYAINPRFEGNDAKEFNEYIFKATYKLQNNIGLEFFQSAVGDGQDKTQLRLRYQF